MGKVNVAIIGGSGFWSEISHHKHFCSIREKVDVSLAAIVDPVDPKSVTRHEHLQEMILHSNTKWINPSNFSDDTDAIIKHLVENMSVNLVIIASTPCTHYDYGMSAIKHRVNSICDKPIVSHDNASSDPNAAGAITKRYNEMLAAYQEAKKDTPTLLFHSILRRRALRSFERVAKDLKKVYKETGAGVNNMSIIVNGGKYKFPAELDKPGAHGYLEGVGSISHSAYHYLDIMSWYLESAPGRAYRIRPRLNYVFRVSDYLKVESYASIAKLIDVQEEGLATPALSKETLGCELNAGFTFDLLDADDNLIGSSSLLFNLVSFSPRILKYDEKVHEPADHKGGGRMSHVILDVHQDGLQSWQVIKNDIVFEDSNIHATCRRHPLLSRETFESFSEEDAYTAGLTLGDLMRIVVQKVSQNEVITNHPNIRSLDEERLAMQLYGQCYRLLAQNYQHENEDAASIDILI